MVFVVKLRGQTIQNFDYFEAIKNMYKALVLI